MKKMIAMGMILSLTVLLTTGCGALSLFSSQHTHYHDSDQTKQKVQELEKRVDQLEKTTPANPAPGQ
jgi:ABC-type Fe3+-citrate transport system substrate-binding protein